MKINIRTIAQDCNVAISTVSRVLNNHQYVSEKTRNKVIESVKKHGFIPNQVASNLRRRKSSFIGLIIPSITYDFFSNVARSIQNRLQHAGYSLFILNTDEDFSKEQFHLQSLFNNKISGIIIFSSDPDKAVSMLPDDGLPVMMVDRYTTKISSRGNTVMVGSDNYAGGRKAAQELIDRGATRIAFVMTDKRTMPQQLREAGFLSAMKENQINPSNYRIVPSAASPENVTQTIRQLRNEFAFDGLFCGNDRIAFGALYGLLEMNVSIPNQLQVIGFDDIDLVQYLKPALSTIRQNIDGYGQIISEKIVQMIEENELNEKIVIPVDFIERETTRKKN